MNLVPLRALELGTIRCIQKTVHLANHIIHIILWQYLFELILFLIICIGLSQGRFIICLMLNNKVRKYMNAQQFLTTTTATNFSVRIKLYGVELKPTLGFSWILEMSFFHKKNLIANVYKTKDLRTFLCISFLWFSLLVLAI